MLAATIRVQTGTEWQIGAVVSRDDGAGVIPKNLRGYLGRLFTRIIMKLEL
jgi:hypothetical protein